MSNPTFVQLRIGGGRAHPREASITSRTLGGRTTIIEVFTVRDSPSERTGRATIYFATRKDARQFARRMLEQACDSCGGTGMIAGVTCRHGEPS